MVFEQEYNVELNRYKLESYISLIDEQKLDIRAKERLKVNFVKEFLELEHAIFVDNDLVVKQLIKEL